MTKTALVLTAEYRESGYSATEIQALRSALEDLGAVRLRAHRLPAAGGSTEVWILASFVGGSVASGLIGHIAGKVYDRLAERLLAFFRVRKQRDGLEPEMTLTVSYDDVDIAIGPVEEADVAALPALVQRIYERLSSPPLQDAGVTKVVIGMVRQTDGWQEPHLQSVPTTDGSRFWGVSLEGHRHVTHIFDTETKLLAERPDRNRRG